MKQLIGLILLFLTYTTVSAQINQDQAIDKLEGVVLQIPNAFTPDNNGFNDCFKATVIGFENWTLTVFDRWGNEVYKTTDQNFCWDGTFNGKTLPPAVYLYVFSGTSKRKSPIQKTGTLTLVRPE